MLFQGAHNIKIVHRDGLTDIRDSETLVEYCLLVAEDQLNATRVQGLTEDQDFGIMYGLINRTMLPVSIEFKRQIQANALHIFTVASDFHIPFNFGHF